MSPRHIAFFLTGHGFGHGVRASAIMNALPANVSISIFSSLPLSFFREELQRTFEPIPCEIDCGCIQPDTLQVDRIATLMRYAEIHRERDQTIAFWSQDLLRRGVDAVVGDIPPLAFPIAQAAGLPSFAISNFAWTDIYAPYVSAYPAYTYVLEQMRQDYALATMHLRLEPYHGGDLGPPSHSLGLLARRGQERRQALAQRFSLNPEARWGLIYIGSYGLPGVNWARLGDFDGWQFLGLYDLPGAGPEYRRIEKTPDFAYADLTASCDMILGKLGYGLVGEALAHGKPIVFPGREHFSEYEHLKQVVESRGLGREISLSDLFQLNLQPYLDWASGVHPLSEPTTAIPRILKHLGF